MLFYPIIWSSIGFRSSSTAFVVVLPLDLFIGPFDCLCLAKCSLSAFDPRRFLLENSNKSHRPDWSSGLIFVLKLSNWTWLRKGAIWKARMSSPKVSRFEPIWCDILREAHSLNWCFGMATIWTRSSGPYENDATLISFKPGRLEDQGFQTGPKCASRRCSRFA